MSPRLSIVKEGGLLDGERAAAPDVEDRPAAFSTSPPGSSATEHIVTAARGGGILLFGSLFEYAGRFLFGILVARSIGAAGYGLSVLGVTVATTFATIARVGLSEGIVHFLPGALRERDGTRAWDLLQVGLIVPSLTGLGLGGIVLLLSRFLATRVFGEPAMAPILQWAGIGIPLISLGYTLMSATRGFMHMHYHMFAESFILNLGRIALTLLFLFMGLAATGVMAAYTITWIFVVGFLLIVLNRLFALRRSLHWSKQTAHELLSFSAPVCLTQLTNQFNGNSDLLFLGMLGTATWVGIYSGATRLQLVGVMFLAATEMVAKPIISDLFHRSEFLQLGRIYQTLTRWCLSFIVPYFITILLFASPLLSIFGAEFKAGTPALILLSIGMLVNAGTGICGAMIIMTGHSRLEFLNIASALIVNTALNILLIPRWGMLGAAVGTALTVSAINIARLIEIYKFHKLWPYDETVFKPLMAGIAALLVGILASRLLRADQNLIALVVDFAAVWLTFASATVLLGLSEEDHMLLSSARKRLSGLYRRD